MKILVVNDDGIQAEGIKKLAEMARQFGEVTVAAPKHQCSGMSHRISIDKAVEVAKVEFPVEGVTAYSVDGTPADCVKLGVDNIMREKPDIVFSGINKGYNVGYETLYSGTVGAAMEALVHGIPAIAYSQDNDADYETAEKYFKELTELLLKEKIEDGQIWNVNFPNCKANEVKGILFGTVPAKVEFYHNQYAMEKIEENLYMAKPYYGDREDVQEGTDIAALLNNCISAGKLSSIV